MSAVGGEVLGDDDDHGQLVVDGEVAVEDIEQPPAEGLGVGEVAEVTEKPAMQTTASTTVTRLSRTSTHPAQSIKIISDFLLCSFKNIYVDIYFQPATIVGFY